MPRTFALTLHKQGWMAELAMAMLGSLALWLSAKIQIPFWPVPMTMQTLVVVLLPLLFGLRAGVGAVALYLVEGMSGLPVFAGTPQQGLGLAYMMGPTGGFLMGFAAGAVISGLVAHYFKPGFLTGLLAATLGHAAIFIFGLVWLAQGTGWQQAVAVGLTPFLAATPLKIGLAAAITKIAYPKA